mmetsp:Transcript_18592/g.37640  ORF Transcript_18592/g.37640 Transcript_18592/m.37640 type:complete len:210 (-) Transcript_18592:1948-2577(-)
MLRCRPTKSGQHTKVSPLSPPSRTLSSCPPASRSSPRGGCASRTSQHGWALPCTVHGPPPSSALVPPALRTASVFQLCPVHTCSAQRNISSARACALRRVWIGSDEAEVRRDPPRSRDLVYLCFGQEDGIDGVTIKLTLVKRLPRARGRGELLELDEAHTREGTRARQLESAHAAVGLALLLDVVVDLRVLIVGGDVLRLQHTFELNTR